MSSQILVLTNNVDLAKRTLQAITHSPLTSASSESEWTIDNKYYSASVKFVWAIKDTFEGLHAFESSEEDGEEIIGEEGGGMPLAVVWIHEDDEETFVDLCSLLNYPSLEVRLALSTFPIVSSPLSSTGDENKNEELDLFFLEHSFELVSQDKGGNCPRLIDALSTIMWPDMVRKSSSISNTSVGVDGKRKEKVKPGDLLERTNFGDGDVEGAEEGFDIEIDEAMIEALGKSLMSMNVSTSVDAEWSKARFKMDFENWLEEDEDADEGNRLGSLGRGMVKGEKHIDRTLSNDFPVPASLHPPSASANTELRFDDDFGEFRSIPSPDSTLFQVLNSPTSSSIEQSGLSLLPASAVENENQNEEVEVELPTREEILETSRILFPHLAASRFSTATTSTTSNLTLQSLPKELPTPDSTKISASKDSINPITEPEVEPTDPLYDLSTLLPTLQSMKDQISGLPSMEERRRAAAKVALGLVLALEGEL